MDKVVNILLVEDDYLDIIDVKRTLEKMHILNNMVVAKNGEDALQILTDKSRSAESSPDIALIDINMPKMNGLEFLQEKLKDTSLKNIPVIMLSASPHIREDAFKYGATAFIDKAGDDVSLRNNLQLALDSLAAGR